MSQKIFVVTGANKGIGLGIVQGLAKQLPKNEATIYLTARNTKLGEEAVKGQPDNVKFHQLDITDELSCKKFADFLKANHGGLDVLINNAGFAFPNASTEPAGVQADATIGVNYYGTKLISDVLIPFIRPGGRIVNVCSQMGIMTGVYKAELIDVFSRPDFTVKDIDNFVEQYKKLAHEDRRKEGGYPESAYRVSKAAEIALTMIQARELAAKGITVNACCPGYVDTDMTNHKGHLKVEQGVETPIWLATAGDVPNGKFVYKKKPKGWLHDGNVDFA